MAIVLIDPDRDLIDVFSALLTPIIALLAAYIAYMQRHTNERRRKSEYFDRRIAVYEAIAQYLGKVLALGRVENDTEMKFLSDTTNVFFLFGADVRTFVLDILKKSQELHTLQTMQDQLSGKNLEDSLAKHDEIIGWFNHELRGLEKSFKRYLSL
jgi:hypothetical protein